jgi:hypothetical protein
VRLRAANASLLCHFSAGDELLNFVTSLPFKRRRVGMASSGIEFHRI